MVVGGVSSSFSSASAATVLLVENTHIKNSNQKRRPKSVHEIDEAFYQEEEDESAFALKDDKGDKKGW